MRMSSAFYDLPAGGYIEVVAPTRDDSAISGALAKSGEGMNLIAFLVDDLEATCEAYKAAGARLVGEGGPQVMVHPKSTHGILIQLKQKEPPPAWGPGSVFQRNVGKWKSGIVGCKSSGSLFVRRKEA